MLPKHDAKTAACKCIVAQQVCVNSQMQCLTTNGSKSKFENPASSVSRRAGLYSPVFAMRRRVVCRSAVVVSHTWHGWGRRRRLFPGQQTTARAGCALSNANSLIASVPLLCCLVFL